MDTRIKTIQKGEPVPQRVIDEVKSLWSRDVIKRFEERSKIRQEDRQYRDRLTARLLQSLSGEKDIKEAGEGIKALAHRLAKRKLKPLKSHKVEPEIRAGSLISVLAPPYDTIWSQNVGNASGNHSHEDDLGGTFGFDVVADGDAYAAAAVGSFYRPVSSNPVGHLRPFLRCSYHYVDSAWYASTAHNDGWLHARVVSMDSNFNIVKWPPDDASFQLWTDGVSIWDGTHDVEVDDDWPGQLDVPFELAADHVYLLWCWCECSLDDGSASIAASSMNVTVPFMVVQETNI